MYALCIIPNESREVDGVQHGPDYQYTLCALRLSQWYQRSLPMVLFVMPLVPMVKAVGRTLNARTVLYTVRVGQSRVSDMGQTKFEHCIVISESWRVSVFDTEGSD